MDLSVTIMLTAQAPYKLAIYRSYISLGFMGGKTGSIWQEIKNAFLGNQTRKGFARLQGSAENVFRFTEYKTSRCFQCGIFTARYQRKQNLFKTEDQAGAISVRKCIERNRTLKGLRSVRKIYFDPSAKRNM